MVNKYAPKTECAKCQKEVWDYNEDTAESKCPHCNNAFFKKLHPLVGGIISKNERGNYVLSFPLFGETNEFASWERLQEEMEELHKNETGEN